MGGGYVLLETGVGVHIHKTETFTLGELADTVA